MAEAAGRGVLANRVGCEAAVGRVRPDEIVVEPPALDDGAGLGEAGEDLLVQALVAEPAVEALDEAVLLRLARGDVVPGTGRCGWSIRGWRGWSSRCRCR